VSRQYAATADRWFQFQKRTQLFIRSQNETLSVAAMCVSNPDCSPVVAAKISTVLIWSPMRCHSVGVVWRAERCQQRNRQCNAQQPFTSYFKYNRKMRKFRD
jgi:hypothetical protein